MLLSVTLLHSVPDAPFIRSHSLIGSVLMVDAHEVAWLSGRSSYFSCPPSHPATSRLTLHPLPASRGPPTSVANFNYSSDPLLGLGLNPPLQDQNVPAPRSLFTFAAFIWSSPLHYIMEDGGWDGQRYEGEPITFFFRICSEIEFKLVTSWLWFENSPSALSEMKNLIKKYVTTFGYCSNHSACISEF